MSVLEFLTLGVFAVGIIGIVGAACILGPHIPELSHRYGMLAVLGVCLACVLAWPLVLAFAIMNAAGASAGSGSKQSPNRGKDILPTAEAARDLLGN